MNDLSKDKSAESTATQTHPIVGLRDQIEHVFDNFMRGWPQFGRMGEFDPFKGLREPLDMMGGAWLTPSVDISETDGMYEITAELPGIEDKDIELTLKDAVLTLKASKHAEREQKDKNYHLSERSYGVFQRAFRLPDDVDPDKITTRFMKGVLTVQLPKMAVTPPSTRKIEVKAG